MDKKKKSHHVLFGLILQSGCEEDFNQYGKKKKKKVQENISYPTYQDQVVSQVIFTKMY